MKIIKWNMVNMKTYNSVERELFFILLDEENVFCYNFCVAKKKQHNTAP